MRSIIVFLLLVTITILARGQDRGCVPLLSIPDSSRAFKDGETLIYVINYQWGFINTNVGEAKTSLKRVTALNYGNHFHAVITGHTYKFYDVFFKVRDLFESRFNTTNGRPYYFHRDIEEGRYRIKNNYNFNEDYTINAVVERKNSSITDTLLVGKECTFDLVSLFYFARNIDFSRVPLGIPQPISFAIDDEVFNMDYKYLGKESLRVQGLGTFRTMKFSARVVAGEVFDGKEEIILWVSDDNNRVPLLFESAIKVGKVRGLLTVMENLKFPLTSKIN